jgi:hypothetical protein
MVMLALSGSGIFYAWPEITSLVPSVGRETPAEQVAASDRDVLPELLASQQKVEEHLTVLTKSVSDQQEQVMTVSNQLAALTSKVDALQRPAPPPLPASVIAEQPAVSIAPAASKPKKPPLPFILDLYLSAARR